MIAVPSNLESGSGPDRDGSSPDRPEDRQGNNGSSVLPSSAHPLCPLFPDQPPHLVPGQTETGTTGETLVYP